MDEDAAELKALRRRAYGPDADIHADPTALARLEQLEEQVRREREAALSTAVAPSASGPAVTAAAGRGSGATNPTAPGPAAPGQGVPGAGWPGPVTPNPAVAGPCTPASAPPAPPAPAAVLTDPATAPEPAPPARRRWVVAGAVLVVGAVIVAGQVWDASRPQASGPQDPGPLPTAEPTVLRAQDASERTLLEIPLDRSLSRYVPQPAAPRFPVEGALRWSQSLGSYYGMTVWLGRAAHTDQRCILLEAPAKTFSRCERENGFLQGLLDVTVPYVDIAPEERPLAMAPGQGMVVRWAPDQGVQIALDEVKVSYFGGNGRD